MTNPSYTMSNPRWLLVFLSFLCWAAFGAPIVRPVTLAIRAIPATDAYVIGEPMPVTIIITNTFTRSGIMVDFVFADDRTTGITVELSHLDSGRHVPFIGHRVGGTEGTIPPGAAWVVLFDLAAVFKIEDAGRYGFRIRYRERSIVTVFDDDGKRIGSEIHKGMDIQSELVEIVVQRPDAGLVSQIERLLWSEADGDLEKALELLATVRRGVYRETLPSLWAVVRARQQPDKNQALKVFLGRIDLADDRISDDELFAELALAATDADASLRLATAEAIDCLNNLYRRPRSLIRFGGQNIPKWFDHETSPACRAVLLRRMPILTSERLVAVVQQDADPQVRLAAIQRLIALDPDRFLQVAEDYSHLSGQVTLDGTNALLGAFVTSERVRVTKELRAQE